MQNILCVKNSLYPRSSWKIQLGVRPPAACSWAGPVTVVSPPATTYRCMKTHKHPHTILLWYTWFTDKIKIPAWWWRWMRETSFMVLQSLPLEAFNCSLATDQMKNTARHHLEIMQQCLQVLSNMNMRAETSVCVYVWCDLRPAAVLCLWHSWAEWQPVSGSCLQQRFHRYWRCGPQSGKVTVSYSLIGYTWGAQTWQIL